MSKKSKMIKYLDGQYHTFTGYVVRFGCKIGFAGKSEPTLQLRNVTCDGKYVAKYLWLGYEKNILKLGELFPNDKIKLDGRVSIYFEGKNRKKITYKIIDSTKASIVKSKKEERNDMPIDDSEILIGYIMWRNHDYYLKNGRPYDPILANRFKEWASERGWDNVDGNGNSKGSNGEIPIGNA